MRYFVRFSYLGTDFHGSQTQPNGITVQEVMEKAFSTVLRMPVALTFAGRTDAGVHATQMYAHFDTGQPLPAGTLAGRLNGLLPPAIAVDEVFAVPDDLHARYSASMRTYKYYINSRKNPFLDGRAALVTFPLDYDKMNEAASLLLGEHDFASFCRTGSDVKTTLCRVTRAEWSCVQERTRQTPIHCFTIAANRFLRNMVRSVVGTLLDVGRGKLSVNDFQNILDARDRRCAGQSAPAEGLFLTRIDYDFLAPDA